MTTQLYLDPHDKSLRTRLGSALLALLLGFRLFLESEGYSPRNVQRKVGRMTRTAEDMGDLLTLTAEQYGAYVDALPYSDIVKTEYITAINQFGEWRRELGEPIAGTAGAIVSTGRRVRREFPADSTTTAHLMGYRRFLRANDCSASTIHLYDWGMRVFASELGDLLAATSADIEGVLARRSHQAANSRKTLRTVSVSFWRGYAFNGGLIAQDPTLNLKKVRVPKRMARNGADASVNAGMRGASADVRAMILLARLGGLRVGEVTKAHTDDREKSEGTLYVIGKGDRERTVPLHPELAAVLDELEALQGPGYYFPGARGGHLHLSTVYKRIKHATGLNPHSLRHAAATTAYNRTRDIRAVQTLLGHSNLSTTEKYVHVDRAQVVAAAHATTLTRD